MAGIEKYFKETTKKQKELTAEWIQNYINPNNCFKDGVSYWEQYNRICRTPGLDNTLIYEHINNMEYADFLDTPYWKAIANNMKKASAFKCVLCDYKEPILHVHHKNYHIHGLEHISKIQERFLIVLCDQCHEMLHERYGYKDDEVFNQDRSDL